MTDAKKTGFDFSAPATLASAVHAQLLARRRATLEHDIKNVVHGLMSGTELLAKAIATPSSRITPGECVNLLQQQLARAQTTLARLLDEVAPVQEAPSDIDLAELVNDCTHALRHQLQMLEVHTTLPAGIKVRAVRTSLKDAVMCILLDCVDQMPKRSRVSIESQLESSSAQAVLTLRHTHASDATSGLQGVVEPLLQAMNCIVAVSAPAGSERQVQLSMPLAVDAPKTAQPFDLIIVDANRDAADSLAMLTQLENFTAQPCYDIQSALESIRASAPKAVLVDLDGSVDSRALVRTIRSEMGAHPRVVGLSHSQGQMLSEFDACLKKPLDPAALRPLLA